jgi:1-acyl-sn-glycerol-3-phosphate acyltransferase
MFITILKLIFLLPVSILLSIFALISIPIDSSGELFRWSPWMWSRIILWTFGIQMTVQGKENLTPGNPYIFVSNHASMFDIPTIMVALKGKVDFVYKKELTAVPVWGWALRFGPFIMIDRSNARDAMQSIDLACETVRRGQSVILFPEGTRTSNGKLQPFKRGAFSLASKANVPIIPVTINNTFGIMPKGSLNIKPAGISVVLEKPISAEGLDGKNDELELMDLVHKAIEKHYIDQS